MDKETRNKLEKEAREELKKRIDKALLSYPKEKIKKALEIQKTKYQSMILFATKDGFGGAPDYDRFRIWIRR